jgi:hypothetical protein
LSEYLFHPADNSSKSLLHVEEKME